MKQGRYAVDRDTGRVGEIVGRYAGSVYLRPPGGGREWAVAPHRLRPPTELERRRAEIYGTPVGGER
ncbi:hypothetical protein [Streptomyces sp. NPDC007172]|uniref:hypothetical protein n=1 Tax=unclassified Streptomyces TaxID=2593676 RepID=UPI0036B6DCCA